MVQDILKVNAIKVVVTKKDQVCFTRIKKKVTTIDFELGYNIRGRRKFENCYSLFHNRRNFSQNSNPLSKSIVEMLFCHETTCYDGWRGNTEAYLFAFLHHLKMLKKCSGGDDTVSPSVQTSCQRFAKERIMAMNTSPMEVC